VGEMGYPYWLEAKPPPSISVMQSTEILQLQMDHAEPLLSIPQPKQHWIVRFFMKILRPNQPSHLPLE
jgi:hypothetical protein